MRQHITPALGSAELHQGNGGHETTPGAREGLWNRRSGDHDSRGERELSGGQADDQPDQDVDALDGNHQAGVPGQAFQHVTGAFPRGNGDVRRIGDMITE